MARQVIKKVDPAFTGRTIIYSDATSITRENVKDELLNAISYHNHNQAEIDYLYHYYKGAQPIRNRKKVTNEEINNKITENIANEIVTFKTSYLMGEPLQYVARRNEEKVIDEVTSLNDMMIDVSKNLKDKELAQWFHICGTAYRMVLATDDLFDIYTLDPRNTFVVYSNTIGNKPLFATTFIQNKTTGEYTYYVYTTNKCFIITNDSIEESDHYLGAIPIIEYPLNSARIGSFEIVLSLLDAINSTDSNRLDDIEQHIQAFLVLSGADISCEQLVELKEQRALKVPTDADVKYLMADLDENGVQVLKDDFYRAVRRICGLPASGDGNTSDSSNNGAMIVKNGWYDAEARAKNTEEQFKNSEKKLLKIIFNILSLHNFDLKLTDVDMIMPRKNYENAQSKAQTLTTLLGCEKIHPKLAFEFSGMFNDPNLAYNQSMEYYNEQVKSQQEELRQAFEQERENANLNEEDLLNKEIDNEENEL